MVPLVRSASIVRCARRLVAAAVGALLWTSTPAAAGVLLRLGDILVAEPGTARISVIDPTTGVRTVISEGGLLGPVNKTVGVALARDGDIIALHRSTGLIRVNAATGGQSILSQGGLLRDPWALAIDKNTGYIYVADSGYDFDRPAINEAGKIIRVDPISGAQQLIAAGSPCTTFPANVACQNTTSPGSYLSHPYGIAIDDTVVPGSLIVADMSSFNGQGAVIRIQPMPGGAQSLLWGPAAASPAPQVVQASPLACPMGVAVEPNGNVLLTSFTFPVPPSPIVPPPAGTYYGCAPPGVFRIDLSANQQSVVNADAPTWTPGHGYAVGDVVRSGPSPSHVHQVVVAGTSGGTVPSWNTSLNGTTADGTIVWRNIGRGDQWLIPFGIDIEPATASPSGYYIIVGDEGHSAAFRLGHDGTVFGGPGPLTGGLSNTTDLDVIDFTPPGGFRVEPIPSNGQPSVALPAGTTQATLSLATNVSATCRSSRVPGVAYADMTITFSGTGGTAHSTTVTGLSDGGVYDFFVRCDDGVGHVNTGDYLISFSIDPPPPPSVASHSPAAGSASVAPNVLVTATFSEPVQPGTIQFELRTAGTLVPATLTYDAVRRTVLLDPVSALIGAQTYTATVAAALDLAGHPLSAPASWTFGVTTPGFQDPPVLTGLDEPMAMQFASDGRVFVAEKQGLIRVFDSLTDPTPDIFADLRTQVHDFGERGLLGLALDPAFPTRPYLYVLYTFDAAIGGVAPRWGSPNGSDDPCPDPTGTGCAVSARLSRLTASGNQMTAEHVLVEDWYQQFPGQSIGDVAFGPDGALYASGGDGAHSTLADAGQIGTASPDPPNEGGALRSQDLQTPADPVTLSGTVIRINPDTGRPVPRATTITIGTPTTDAHGVQSYPVTSVFLGGVGTTVRVLTPTSPAPGVPPRVLYVLPVEAGVDLGSPFGDGLDELRLLDVPNRFNATLIAPSFPIEPWYGDHATDQTRQLESFVISDLVPFGDSLRPAAQRWLVGFSKSGHGALSLILRHPHVFSAAAAWDAPVQLTDLSLFPGLFANFGTEGQFDRYEIPALVTENAVAFQQQPRLWISGDDSAWTAHMQTLHQQMTQAGVLHTFVESGARTHAWFSGWLDGAVTWLHGAATPTSPIDLNEGRITAYGLRRPARFAFRPNTPEIWLGDIGPNGAQEVNRIGNGTDGVTDNFGWPCWVGGSANGEFAESAICQGLAGQAGAVQAPLRTYQSGQPLFSGDTCATGNGSAITGVAFAGAAVYPPAYAGSLFLADRLRQCIWAVPVTSTGQLGTGPSQPVLQAAASPVGLTAGPGGQLFYADPNGGTVRRLLYNAANQAPAAIIQAGPSTSGPSPLVVTFNAAASADPEGASLGYAWDLDGDGAFDDSSAQQVTHTFTGYGRHTVLLLVQDPQGLSHVAAVDVITGDPATTSSFEGIENPLSESGRWDSPGSWADLQKNAGAFANGINAIARLATPLYSSDQYAEITFSQDPGSNSWVGAMTRIQSASNGSGYLAIAFAGEVRLYRADDTGSLNFTLLSSAAADLAVAPRRLRLVSVGNVHRVYFNGAQLISHVASGTLYTGGQPGIAASTFGGPQVRILTFEAGGLNVPGPDTTAPFRSAGQPVGVLPAGTTQTILSLTTDELAACRYSPVAGVAYASMTPFSSTGNTAHSHTLTGLTSGTTYSRYLRCQDAAGNANTDDFVIAFSVASASGVSSSFVGIENPLSEAGLWDSPGSWADLRKDAGAFAIGLNALGRVVSPTFASDQFAEITFSQDPGASSWVGAMTRIQGPNNGGGYLAIAYAGEVRLYRVDDGNGLTFTLLASANADVTAAPRRLRLESVGVTHRVYFNGVELIFHSASGAFYTGGQPGVAASVFGGPQVHILSFEAGNLSTGSSTTTSNFVGLESPLSEAGRWDSPGAWADLHKNDGAYATSLNALGRLTSPLLTDDQYAEITYGQNPGSNSWVGVMTRIQGPSNGSGYLAIAFAGEVRLYRADDSGSPTFTLLASAPTDLAAAPRRLRLVSVGNTHSVFFNATQLIGYTANGTIYTSGQPGLAASVFGGPQVRILTFEAGNFQTGTPTVTSDFSGAEGLLSEGGLWESPGSWNDLQKNGGAFTTGLNALARVVAPPHSADQYAELTYSQDPGSASWVGVMTRIQGPANGSGYLVIAYAGEVRLYRANDAGGLNFVLLASAPANLAAAPRRLRLESQVNLHRVYFNGALLISHVPGGPLYATGQPGVAASVFGGPQVRILSFESGNLTPLAADTAPPIRSSEQPVGVFAAGTVQTTMGLVTDEPAVCRYSTRPGIAFASMTNAFTATGGTGHATVLSSLTSGSSYLLFARCQDGAGNANSDDIVIAFSVASSSAATSNFVGVENPLSEGGVWDSPGAWADLQKSGGLHATALNAAGRLITPPFGADQYSEITYNQDPGSNSWVGVMTRIQGATNGSGYLAIAYAGEVRLYRVDDSGNLGFTLLASAGANLSAVPRRLRLESIGDTHRVFFNGALLVSHVASGILYAAGQPGVVASVFGGPQVRILSFEANALAADSAAPLRASVLPAGVLPAGTTQVTLSLTTDESAVCRYSPVAGVAYSAMVPFTTTGGTTHTTTLAGLANGSSHNPVVRCQDISGNTNADDVGTVFSVASIGATTSNFVGIENPLSEGGLWDSPGSWLDLKKNAGAYAAGLNALARVVTPALSADQYAEIVFSENPGASSWVGVTTRTQGPGDGSGYLAIAYTGEVRLYRADDAGNLNFTLLASATVDVGATPRRLRLESVGTTHRVLFNGAEVISHAASGTVYATGQPGVAASVFGGPQVIIGSFEAGNVGP